MQVTWDPRKARSNLRKHGVSFDEAATVFRDDLARIHDDPEHSLGEHREIIVGYSAVGRLLLVSFTETKWFASSVLAVRIRASDENMKKTRKTSKVSSATARVPRRSEATPESSDMRSHYDFDYTKSKPNRFAHRAKQDVTVVVLEPDVARVFKSGESVNTFLRSAISAMPTTPKKKRAS